MLFLCYPKCSTCQKARKWLDEHGIKYTERKGQTTRLSLNPFLVHT